MRSYTLRAGDRKIRTSANKTYHVAVPRSETLDKLYVTKRTNDMETVLAEIRRLNRQGFAGRTYVFYRGQLVEGGDW